MPCTTIIHVYVCKHDLDGTAEGKRRRILHLGPVFTSTLPIAADKFLSWLEAQLLPGGEAASCTMPDYPERETNLWQGLSDSDPTARSRSQTCSG
jgi:hypothetical protein